MNQAIVLSYEETKTLRAYAASVAFARSRGGADPDRPQVLDDAIRFMVRMKDAGFEAPALLGIADGPQGRHIVPVDLPGPR
jgi:hypothetical protein